MTDITLHRGSTLLMADDAGGLNLYHNVDVDNPEATVTEANIILATVYVLLRDGDQEFLSYVRKKMKENGAQPSMQGLN